MTVRIPMSRRMGAIIVAVVLVVSGCSKGAEPGSSPTETGQPSSHPATDGGAVNPTPQAPASGAATPQPSTSRLDSAVDAQVLEHASGRYLVVTLPLEQWDVRVDWDPQDDGTMLRDVLADDPSIVAATNAGIFTDQLVPGGLLVTDGQEKVGVNLNEGGGNFHLMPNGVFAVLDDGTATVVDSRDYDPQGVQFATQSGPALVLDGDIHPQFNEGSSNLAFRSGVGVSPDGRTVYLAMSWGLTNFYDFATLFTDELGVQDALYLDGDISQLWVDPMAEPGPLAGPYAGVITARPHSTA